MTDHGYNRPATYQHAEALKKLLQAEHQGFRAEDDGGALRRGVRRRSRTDAGKMKRASRNFSAVMKLEPFARGLKELAPTIWLTALRKVQNPNRAGLDIVVAD